MIYDPVVSATEEDIYAFSVQYPALTREAIFDAIVRSGPYRSVVQAALDRLLTTQTTPSKASPTVETIVW